MSLKKKCSIKELQEAFEKKQVFDIYVESVDGEYNLHCKLADGIQGIMPREEVSSIVEEDGLVDSELCAKKKGKIMQACIIELEVEDDNIKRIVLSKKELELKVRKWMYNNLKPGMRLRGVVRGMTDYMAFVDVGGGVTGILKTENISYVRPRKVSDKLKLGQKLEAVVIVYDRDTGNIELSLKELMPKFEERVKQKGIKEGDIIEGTVIVKNKHGLIIELEGDLIGMAEHVSGIEVGMNVIVHVRRIIPEKEKIKLDVIG